MKNLPLTNFDKFEKKLWTDHTPNCEVFWSVASVTFHYQRKNDEREGIENIWKGNPFDLYINCNYVLEK